jgi:5'(3')-deoxyribonucleotidase
MRDKPSLDGIVPPVHLLCMSLRLRFGSAGWPLDRRPRIAIDMDEVIADSLGKHIAAYNRAFGANLGVHDIQSCDFDQAVPPEHAEAVRALELEPEFFADLDVIAGSQEVIADLACRYEVFIATAAMEVPTSFAAKFAWLGRHFPFIPPSHIVFCGDKGVLDVDFLIDDNARHFKHLRGQGVLFSAPHNRGEQGYVRVESWEEVRRLFLSPAASSAAG